MVPFPRFSSLSLLIGSLSHLFSPKTLPMKSAPGHSGADAQRLRGSHFSTLEGYVGRTSW